MAEVMWQGASLLSCERKRAAPWHEANPILGPVLPLCGGTAAGSKFKVVAGAAGSRIVGRL